MTLLRLAFRNVIAAGMRTWLNTFVLTLTLISIILLQGLYDGMYQQMAQSRIKDELGNGQFWHQNYDPFDPLSLENSHAALPPPLKPLVENQDAAPILIVSAAIYPKGRVRSVLLKGITKNQNILKLPTSRMNSQADTGTIPVMVGRRMAKQTGLHLGEMVTARWRTQQGAFDALEPEVVHIFDSDVPAVDQG